MPSPQAAAEVQKFHDQMLSVAALQPLLTEVRVSATLTVGGGAKVALKDKVFYVGPCRIDGDLLAKLGDGGTVDLHMPATSFGDALQFLQEGLSATAGAASQVLRLGQVLESTDSQCANMSQFFPYRPCARVHTCLLRACSLHPGRYCNSPSRLTAIPCLISPSRSKP